MDRVAIAPGKLLLFGEHAAVYGYPAVGTALPLTVTLRHTPGGAEPGRAVRSPEQGRERPREHKRVREDRLDLGGLAVLGIPPRFHDAARALFKRLRELLDNPLDPPLPPLRELTGTVTVETTLPISAGFGSSGAVCAALAELALVGPIAHNRDANEHAETGTTEDRVAAAPVPAPATRHDQWRMANELERLFHGTPSGIDTGLATFGDTRYFDFPSAGRRQMSLPEARPLADPPGILLVGAVPRRGDTKSLVAGIRRAWDRNDGELKSRIAALGDLAAEAGRLLGTAAAGSRSGDGEPAAGSDRTAARGSGRRSGVGAAGSAPGEVADRANGQLEPRAPSPSHTEARTDHAAAGELGRMADAAHEELRALGLSSEELEAALNAGRRQGALGGKLSGAGGGGAFYLVFESESEANGALEALRREMGDRLLASFLVGSGRTGRTG